jgi:hypothetical protein
MHACEWTRRWWWLPDKHCEQWHCLLLSLKWKETKKVFLIFRNITLSFFVDYLLSKYAFVFYDPTTTRILGYLFNSLLLLSFYYFFFIFSCCIRIHKKYRYLHLVTSTTTTIRLLLLLPLSCFPDLCEAHQLFVVFLYVIIYILHFLFSAANDILSHPLVRDN